MTEITTRNARQLAAAHLKEAYGIDVNDPEQLAELKINVKNYRKRIEQTFNRQNILYKAGTYINSSLFNGNQPIDFLFKNWKPDKQKNVGKAKEVANRCFLLAKKMFGEPQKVLLSGKPGVGKTSLAMAMLNALCEKNLTVMTVSTLELARLMSKRIENKDVQDKLDYLQNLMETVDVLLLDDFGTEGSMKNESKSVRQDLQEYLFRIANSRIDLNRNEIVNSTIITTNCSSKDLETMYNPKLISRLLPHKADNIVDFTGLEDMRV